MRNIIITGVDSFIGNSIVSYLREKYDDINILEIDANTPDLLFLKYAHLADFVFHLEEAVRVEDQNDYQRVNIDFTNKLIQALRQSSSQAPIVFLSSHQALARNDYGYSKFMAEQLLISYYQVLHVPVYIYRLPEVFGEGALVDHNSIIATYCYNIINGLPINNHKPEDILKFVNITDVMEEFNRAFCGFPHMLSDSCFAKVPKLYTITRIELIKKIVAFSESRNTRHMPSLAGKFEHQLFTTFMSYIDIKNLACPINKESRKYGCASEFISSQEIGSFQIVRVKPGENLGKHWHEMKVQKFMVVEGIAIIKTEKRFARESLTYEVSGNNPMIIDMPPNFNHDLINVGESDCIVLVWTSQAINESRTDAFYIE